MALATQIDGDLVTIRISGRFDFHMHREFRQAYEKPPTPATRHVLDLSRTDYVDSSALGMLLLLREHAGGDGANIAITRCPPEVKKILTVANFHHLFRFE